MLEYLRRHFDCLCVTMIMGLQCVASASDEFEEREAIGDLPVLIPSDSVGATLEEGEPSHGGLWLVEGGSLWWRWRSPRDGLVFFAVETPNPKPLWLMSIYEGDQFGELDEVVSGFGWQASVMFHARTGVEYQIAVGGLYNRDRGAFNLRAEYVNETLNDSSRRAQELGSVQNVRLSRALIDFGVSPSRSSYNQWWKWIAPERGSVVVEAALGERRIHDGSPDQDIPIEVGWRTAPDDLTWGGAPQVGQIGLEVIPGQEIYFYTGSVFSAYTPIDLNLVFSSSPPNDDIANAFDTGSRTVYRELTAAHGITEDPQQDLPGVFQGEKAWWRWKAPGEGWFEVDARITPYRPLTLIDAKEEKVVPFSQEGPLFRAPIINQRSYWVSLELGSFEPVTLMWYYVDSDGNDDLDHINVGISTNRTIDTAKRVPSRLPLLVSDRLPNASSSLVPSWYYWEAPQDGMVSIEFSHYEFNSDNYGVFEGAQRQPVDFEFVGETAIAFPIKKSSVYHIMFSTATDRDCRLVAHFQPYTRDHDHFEDAKSLGSARDIVIEDNFSLTTSEPSEPGWNPQKSLWWRWQAPHDINGVWIDVERNFIATGIYQGTQLSDLKSLIPPTVYPRKVRVIPGEYYYIQAYPEEPTLIAGAFPLTIAAYQRPLNDDFEDAIDLAELDWIQAEGSDFQSLALIANLEDASWEPDEWGAEPHFSEGSLWWRWRAEEDGEWQITVNEGEMKLYEDGELDWELTGELKRFGEISLGFSEGQSYHFQAVGTGDLNVTFRHYSSPPNDRWANAADLGNSTNVNDSVSSVGSTRETSEPNHDGDVPGWRTLWWRWRSDRLQQVTLRLTGGRSQRLAVYTGDELESLDQIAQAGRSLQFQAEACVDYAIVTYTLDPDSVEELTLDLNAHLKPHNDDFDSRIQLESSRRLDVVGDLTGGTVELTDDEFPGDEASVWWSWTAPETGRALLRYVEGDGRLVVYQGTSLSDLTRVRQFDKVGFPYTLFAVDAGQTFHLSYRSTLNDFGNTRPVAFRIESDVRPENDTLAGSIDLGAATEFTDIRSMVAAISNGGDEPETGGGMHTLWWRWQAADSHALWLTARSELDASAEFSITVYDAEDLSQSYEEGLGSVLFDPTAGQRYYIVVDALNPEVAEGDVSLIGKNAPRPLNDNRADALDLGRGETVMIQVNNLGASAEENEINHGVVLAGTLFKPIGHVGVEAQHSVWYRWLPTTTGHYKITTDDADLRVSIVSAGRQRRLNVLDPMLRTRTYTIHLNGDELQELAFDSPSLEMGEHFVTIGLAPLSRPENDDIENARLLIGDNPTESGMVDGATVIRREPKHRLSFADPREPTRSVWYVWQAERGGRYVVTVGAELDLMVAVYKQREHFPAAVGSVVANKEANADRLDRFSFDAQLGVVYQIAVVSTDLVGAGDFRLAIERADVAEINVPSTVPLPQVTVEIHPDRTLSFEITGIP